MLLPLLLLSIELKLDQKFVYETEWTPAAAQVATVTNGSKSEKVEPIKLLWELKVIGEDKQKFTISLKQGEAQPVTWQLNRNNSIANRPPTSPGIPTKIWRIIEGLLPSKPNEAFRNKSWLVDYFEGTDSEGSAAMQVTFKKPKTIFSYREGSGAHAIGECIQSYQFPLPSYLKIQFIGGTTFVLNRQQEKKKDK